MKKTSKLSEHKFKKGKFVTPFNQHLKELIKENSWYYGRMPEYLWLGLIIQDGERSEQLFKCKAIIDFLKDIDKGSEIYLPKLSLILKLPKEKQESLFDYLGQLGVLDSLKPLSVLVPVGYEDFLAYLKGYKLSIKDRIDALNNIIQKLSNHQSYLSTDIRYLIIYNFSLSNKLVVSSYIDFNFYTEYPRTSHEDEKMRMFRPQIRAMEIGLSDIDLNETLDFEYIVYFWKSIGLLTDCEVFYLDLNSEGKIDLGKFKESIYDILEYYTRLFQETRPLDNKMQVLLGILTYSYKRIIELVDHNLECTISGRTIIRSLIENYMMTKYLLQEEKNHEDIWTDYQYYGLGQYKLIYKRYEENQPDINDSHVPYEYINVLVSEFKYDEFIDMDTKYFGEGNIRQKFDQIGEGDLYRYYYDYDSAYEHGLWGAIRESSILKCNAPGHQYHGVPDIDNKQKLNSVAGDCVMVIRKHIDVLNQVYPIPKSLKGGVYEQ